MRSRVNRYAIGFLLLFAGCGAPARRGVADQKTVAASAPAAQTVTTGGFFERTKGCVTDYVPGGLDAGELDVFCADEQYDLIFFAKDSSAGIYVDEFIFKKDKGKIKELTDDYSVYNQFDCYAFVYAYGRPQAGALDINAKFPFLMSGFKRISGDKWQKIATTKINTAREVDEFERKTEAPN